jgi:hypothetical protein
MLIAIRLFVLVRVSGAEEIRTPTGWNLNRLQDVAQRADLGKSLQVATKMSLKGLHGPWFMDRTMDK